MTKTLVRDGCCILAPSVNPRGMCAALCLASWGLSSTGEPYELRDRAMDRLESLAAKLPVAAVEVTETRPAVRAVRLFLDRDQVRLSDVRGELPEVVAVEIAFVDLGEGSYMADTVSLIAGGADALARGRTLTDSVVLDPIAAPIELQVWESHCGGAYAELALEAIHSGLLAYRSPLRLDLRTSRWSYAYWREMLLESGDCHVYDQSVAEQVNCFLDVSREDGRMVTLSVRVDRAPGRLIERYRCTVS